MKKLTYLLTLFLVLSSCSSTKINDAVIRNSEIKYLSDYYTYVFLLRSTNKTTEETPVPLNFSNGVDTEKGLIYEMLYLLRNKTTNEVLYLTTKSHKFIFEGGIFNDKLNLYNRFNILNDIDNISIGKEIDNKFIFLDLNGRKNSKRVVFNFTEKGDIIKFDSITNNYPKEQGNIKKSLIILDSVFATSIKFKKNLKRWVFAWEDQKYNRGGESFDNKEAYEYANEIFINYPFFFIRTTNKQGHFDYKFSKLYYHSKNRKIRKVNF
ncbi:hypothetical protein MPF19_04535 [Polaribacter sp. Z014]|uniref:hypothetical protein n=1 Tax=Polaribacter sp. Z014 TaxID=2927126 RepID=UPI002021A233|nr:hypothetical protein [Polaribacter sp. Z014]MCL7762672.1 hypothetical protein [Polaribacter sp. Z014]